MKESNHRKRDAVAQNQRKGRKGYFEVKEKNKATRQKYSRSRKTKRLSPINNNACAVLSFILSIH
jgi:hypothetical protein